MDKKTFIKNVSKLASYMYKNLKIARTFREAQKDAAQLLLSNIQTIEYFAEKHGEVISRPGILWSQNENLLKYWDCAQVGIRCTKNSNVFNVYDL